MAEGDNAQGNEVEDVIAKVLEELKGNLEVKSWNFVWFCLCLSFHVCWCLLVFSPLFYLFFNVWNISIPSIYLFFFLF